MDKVVRGSRGDSLGDPRSDDATSVACSECGAALPAGTRLGPCPGCLMEIGFGLSTEEFPDRFDVQPEYIGPYRILQLIGAGGMGLVYLAEQEVPVRRRVALKVIKVGMDTREVLARFETERQALAIMDHPNIAKVLDAGQSETDRPYFVMELVRGEPIARYCERHGLSVRQRLELFAPVCHAIQHAHHKGIIHRDLKPSNILVGVSDDQPVPKIIDFGIAKATSPALTARTLFTRQGALLGTPAYMSPEQAAMSGIDVDTRSDVYSLGAVLYELLTGVPPFDHGDLQKAGFAEIQRILREEEPSRPSTKVRTLGPDSTCPRTTHTGKTHGLIRTLRRDLDWIVLKAMAKDRTRRYGTADALAQDVVRYLRDEPVEAGPPSVAYRMRKLARRNRVTLVIAAAILFGIVGSSLGLFVAWRGSERQREEVEAALAETEEAKSESEAVTAFLVDMLASPDPAEKGRDVTVREVLDAAAGTIGDRLGDRPAVEARLRATMGQTYQALGLYDQSQSQLERSLEVRRRALGDSDPRTLDLMSELGVIYGMRGRYEAAEPLLVEVLETRRDVLGEEHLQTLESVANLAVLYKHQRRFEEAEPLYRESFESWRQKAGLEHPKTLVCMNNLAVLYFTLGRYQDALPLYEQAIEIRRGVLGGEHPATLSSTNNLAALYHELGWYEDAEALLIDLLDTSRRVLGEDHPQTLHAMNNIALVYAGEDRLDEAESVQVRALDAGMRVVGAEHPTTLSYAGNMAYLYGRQRRYEESESLFLRTIDVQRRVLGEEHRITLKNLGRLAEVYALDGRGAEGKLLASSALETAVRTLPPEAPLRGDLHRQLASCLRGQGRYEDIELHLIEAYTLYEQTLGTDGGRTIETVREIADLYESWGRPEQSREWRRKIPSTEDDD